MPLQTRRSRTRHGHHLERGREALARSSHHGLPEVRQGQVTRASPLRRTSSRREVRTSPSQSPKTAGARPATFTFSHETTHAGGTEDGDGAPPKKTPKTDARRRPISWWSLRSVSLRRGQHSLFHLRHCQNKLLGWLSAFSLQRSRKEDKANTA